MILLLKSWLSIPLLIMQAKTPVSWQVTGILPKKAVNINSNVEITAANTVGNNNYVYGVLASNADVTVNGNLKADVDGGKGGYDHTSDSAIMAQAALTENQQHHYS